MPTFQDKIGPMGWGEDKLQLGQKMAMERYTMDHFEAAASEDPNHTVRICSAQEASETTIPEAIFNVIKSYFKFDEGFDFRPVDKLVYGEALTFEQNIGNCVGASHVMLIASRIAIEVLGLGDLEDVLGRGQLSIPFCPFSYGVGRWVGGMLGPGDGSYCGAQIEGTMKYGFLPCFTPGLDSYTGSGASGLPQGTSSAGRLFGRSKSEIEKWLDKAIRFDLLEAPKCKSVEDATELIEKKFTPIQICSGWGFRFSHYDSKYGINIYKPGGNWSHSMQIIASFRIKGQGFKTVRNQWGNAHKDGITFDITDEDFARWVKSAEAIGIGQIQGLPANPGL